MRVYYGKGQRELNCGYKNDAPWIEFIHPILKVLNFPSSVLPPVSLQNSILLVPKNLFSKNQTKTLSVNMFFRILDTGQRRQEVRTFYA